MTALLESAEPELVFGGRQEAIGIAAGWDAGGPLYLGYFTRAGFKLNNLHDSLGFLQRRQQWFREKYGIR
ncbi:MAG: hypothetical protein AB7K24_15805 [Gemmataceae bacterium]